MAKSILVVDDSEAMRTQIRRMLEESGLDVTVREADDGAVALPIALSGEVDIIVSDLVMPRLDGMQLLRAIRQHKDAESLPFILCTSQTDGETRATSAEEGASDYLAKPFSAGELLARIHVQLRLLRLQEELRRQTERFAVLGTQDELTGLANRRHFLDMCRRELSRSRRHGFAMTIAVLDVDDFHVVNSKVGHLVGDAIIAELSLVLGKQLRREDALARIEGEKFALLLPQTNAAEGKLVADRIASAIRAYTFAGQAPGDLRLSVGAATYPQAGIESVDELINAAEACLDRAKELGGNRVEQWAVAAG